jgi:ATP-binding cassette, subfamily C, bacteriocin exporter
MKANIRLVTQKNKWYCGPASVKMVLDSYGIIKSQDEIGNLLSVKECNGCDIPLNLGKFSRLGLEAKYKKNSSLKEVEKLLNKNVFPILYWNRRKLGGHYSVFAKIKNGKVYIADPGNSHNIVSFSKKRFLERWKDPDNSKDQREIIIIRPKNKRG